MAIRIKDDDDTVKATKVGPEEVAAEARKDAEKAAEKEKAVKVEGDESAARSAEAVSAASKQQDRGESWRKFAAAEAEAEVPESVEEKMRAEREQQLLADEQEEEKKKRTVREIQNELSIRERKIRS